MYKSKSSSPFVLRLPDTRPRLSYAVKYEQSVSCAPCQEHMRSQPRGMTSAHKHILYYQFYASPCLHQSCKEGTCPSTTVRCACSHSKPRQRRRRSFCFSEVNFRFLAKSDILELAVPPSKSRGSN